MRLIFVADKIPDGLRRIVVFLNEQMNPAEVLAVEIKQHVAEGQEEKAFVPRLIGYTAHAERVKSTGADKSWDEECFTEELEAKQDADAAATVRKIQEWAQDTLSRSEWQRNGQHAVFHPCLNHKGVPNFSLRVGTDGRFGVVFQWLNAGKPSFGDEKKREELLHRLNEIPGVDIPAHRIIGVPAFHCPHLETKQP